MPVSSISRLFESLEDASSEDEVIVDFDETLFLRNSTAEYLAAARPRLPCALVFRILGLIRPWKWLTPGNAKWSKDWFQIVAITILFPWNIWLWKKRAKNLAEVHSNEDLTQALASTQAKITVASYGYRFIIKPILDKMALESSSLVACRFWGGYHDRLRGKPSLLNLDSHCDSKTIAITDSTDDQPLLDQVDAGYLIEWPQATSRDPFADVYVPFAYLTKVKRPGQKYFIRNILGDDLPLYLLAFSISGTGISFIAGIAVLFFLVSFWCIYELGYFENDRLGEIYEEAPKLTENYHKKTQAISETAGWAWALCTALLGSAIVHFYGIGNLSFLPTLVSWFSVLLGTRLCFHFYNRLPTRSRPRVYPFLQLFRYLGIASVIPCTLIGSFALLSQVLGRSLIYLVYRLKGGNTWPDLPEQLIRLGIFLSTLLVLAISLGTNLQSFALVTALTITWFTIRASRQIVTYLTSTRLAQPVAHHDIPRIVNEEKKHPTPEKASGLNKQ